MELILQLRIGDEEAGVTIRDALQKKHGMSRRTLTTAKFEGDIRVNGQSVYVTHRLSAGDTLEVYLPQEESETLAPEPMNLTIRHEDDDLLILSKPAGIVVHPTLTHKSGTLANGVIAYWRQKGEIRKFRPVNRIDKDTSGLVIVAKNQWASERCGQLQRQGTLKRTYQAIVEGVVSEDEGMIDLPIGHSDDSIITRTVREDGKRAVTLFRVLGSGATLTWMELSLMTGRTHQIRVHMSHLGHPLAGDDLYGGSREWINRQALHAVRLSFPHPRTGEIMQFSDPLPDDMRKLIEKVAGNHA